MQCPSCQHPESRVLESRSTEAGKSIRRRRECSHCRYRFTTYERLELVPLAVIKRGGQREEFSREKLLRGLRLACEKTTVSPSRLEAIADRIEAQLRSRSEREIPSTKAIGALVLDLLRAESDVAYIRFASVHQQFQDIQDFAATLDRLKDTPNNETPIESRRSVGRSLG